MVSAKKGGATQVGKKRSSGKELKGKVGKPTVVLKKSLQIGPVIANSKKSAPAKQVVVPGKKTAGYATSGGGILIPDATARPAIVPLNRLEKGIEESRDQIVKSLKGLAAVFTTDFTVSEIELTLSFSADGKFLGFGVGGEMSVTVRIQPSGE